MSITLSCACCGCDCRGECGVPPSGIVVSNPAGLDQIAYRVGAFPTFRRALLEHLPGETELDVWRPTAGTDLGLQVVDWWSYIADVLTFYNERIANEHYVGTAVQDTSLHRLVSLLGYRPRPGIGATATLAVVASGPAPLVVPAGTAIASKATPGTESQTFETTSTTTFAQPTSVPAALPDDLSTTAAVVGPPPSSAPGAAQVPPHLRLLARGGVLVKGVPTSIAVGDRLLLRTKAWASANDPAVVVQVTGTVVERDPRGRKNTRVLLAGTGTLPGSAVAGDYRLARSTRTMHLSSLPAGATVATGTTLVLDGAARFLKAGDPLLVEKPGAGLGVSPGASFDVVRLSSYAESLWYANALPASPGTPPTGDVPGIPVVVSTLTVGVHSGANLAGYQSGAATVTVRAGWNDVGVLLDTPVATVTGLGGKLTLARPPAVAAGVARTALVEDAHGTGARVTLTPQPGTNDVTVGGGAGAPALRAPLTVLWDLVQVSRGATVRDEVLGTGQASLPGQDFALAKSPVTYLASAPGRSGDGYSSTVVLRVGGRYWTEVPTLYGHGPDEQVFETWVDDEGATHVRTTRLPTGAAVVATYRVGSGAAVPPVGALSQVLTSVPNLRSVRNPVVPVGGADPEPAADVRWLAPRSVLTFGRAISSDDYAAVAAAAPGVRRASAVLEWDAAEQRPTVHVYVGDDAGALASAREALAAQADPNRPLVVLPAVRRRAALSLALSVDVSFVAADVVAAVTAALLDDTDGLFAPGARTLGEPLYRSEIERVVCEVPGVLSTSQLTLTRWWWGWYKYTSPGPRFDPGQGGFFTLTPGDLHLSLAEVTP